MSRKNSPKDFEFETCIGEGSYSKVYKAVSIHNHRTYAIKVLNKSHIVKEKKIKYVNIEKNTLNKLGHHPGIVTLHYTFQDSESLYYVIDFALNGELLSLIRKWGSLNEAVSKYYATQLVDAVEFIHSKGIIHRDLKPENILLNHEYKLMITDFGAAKIIDEEPEDVDQLSRKEVPDSRAGSFVGTAEYVSPELLKYNRCGFECDYWALGCIIYQLITGYPPFKGTTEYLTFEKIIKLDYKFPAYYIPGKIKHLVSHLLIISPEERYNIIDIKHHEWFQGTDWANKDSIWKKRVPKIESYNPKFYSIKKDPSSMVTQKTRFDSSKFYVPQGQPLQNSISSIPDHVLQKQIMTPQTNQLAMNKALTQRLIMKTNELNIQQRNAASLASAAATATKNGKYLPKIESSNFQSVQRQRSSSTPFTKSQPSSTMKKTSRPALKSPGSLPTPTFSSPIISSPKPPKSENKSPTINSMSQLVKKSFSSTRSKGSPKPLSSPPPLPTPAAESDVIDLVPLSNMEDVPLMHGEYILKADYIFKSEVPYNGALNEQLELDDTVLNKLIDDNYYDFTNDLRSSLLIITNLGRLLIYEFAQLEKGPVSTLDPKFLSQKSTSNYTETKLIVVNLTNKNISMYEFDGIFIIKDNHSPNIIFLNPSGNELPNANGESRPFAHSSKPGFSVNPEVSWIDTLLTAKDLLKSSSMTSSPSTSSEFSSSGNETTESPLESVEVKMHGLSLGHNSPLNVPKPRNSPTIPQSKVRPTSRTPSSSKVNGSIPSHQRSTSNSSLPHYTQQQSSHPHAHQANFGFLAQAKQNKFASAAAAASFTKR